MAIRSYRDEASRDIALGSFSKQARGRLPPSLHKQARKKFAFLDAANSLVDFRTAPTGYAWKVLTGDRRGQHSIRINDQYRICFQFDGKDCYNVEVTDYHR